MSRTTARTLTALTALSLSTTAMAQGTMTFSWTARDTGNNDGVVGPGESLVVTLWASMDPMQVGFAGSTFDIAGNDEWQNGTIESYDNFFDALTDDGQLQGDNSITNIEAFQLPPFFNPDFDANNPIPLYEIVWTPDTYRVFMVEFVTQNYQNASVYTDDFGTSVEYDVVAHTGMYAIIPSPAATSLLALAGLVATRRRR